MLRRRQIATTITGWLCFGAILALCERWVWDGVWSVTLVVWWGYLSISALMLLRLLIHSWASRWSRGSLGVVWMFVGLALLLLWSRPLLVHAGDTLLLHLRPEVRVDDPANLDGPSDIAPVASGTSRT